MKSSTGSSKHNGNGEAKSLLKDARPYKIYYVADMLIAIALACSCLYLRFTGSYSDETVVKIHLVLNLALTNSWFGAPCNLKNGFHLSIYCVRLLLLAFVSAKYGLFSATKTDDTQGFLTTVAGLCLYSFYVLGVPLFAYRIISHFVSRNRKIARGQWRVDPVSNGALFLYTVADLLAAGAFFFLFLYWYTTAENNSWVLILPVILLSIAMVTWIFGLVGLLYKNDSYLSVYCKRLLILLTASIVCAITCLFVPANSKVLGVFLLCWVCLMPLYTIGTTFFTDKFISLRPNEARVQMEEV